MGRCHRILNELDSAINILKYILPIALYKSNMQREVANQLLDRKVAEHTKELDLNYSRLRKRIEEENMNMRGTMADIKSTIASMKGLNSLAIKEERDTQDNQIQQMDLTIRHLSKILSGMQIRVVACEIENNKNYC